MPVPLLEMAGATVEMTGATVEMAGWSGTVPNIVISPVRNLSLTGALSQI